MVTRKTDAKFCDIEKCGKPAVHVCAGCGKDLCNTEHTHSHGDHGHIEHACPVTVMTFPYGGAYIFYLCPVCMTTPLKKSLFEFEKENGEAMDTSNHYGMG
jgi:hypothetical protein